MAASGTDGVSRRHALTSSLCALAGPAWGLDESKPRFATIHHFEAGASPSTQPLNALRKGNRMTRLVGFAGSTYYAMTYGGHINDNSVADGHSNTYSRLILPSPRRGEQEDTHFAKVYGTETTGGEHRYGAVCWVSCTNRHFVHDYLVFGRHDKLGRYPVGGVIEGFDSALYGCCTLGGRQDDGTIFRIDVDGLASVVHHFDVPAGEAGAPLNGLTAASDGNYYGATHIGGKGGSGALFRLAPDGGFTTLHSLVHRDEGWWPHGALTQAADGLLYGTCTLGGSEDMGTLFSLDLAGRFRHLHSFTGVDGAKPEGKLLAYPDGSLYGTCPEGGAHGHGVVFKYKPRHRKMVVLHDFANDLDEGGRPLAGLTLATDGYLYSSTPEGGQFGGGTMFRIKP